MPLLQSFPFRDGSEQAGTHWAQVFPYYAELQNLARIKFTTAGIPHLTLQHLKGPLFEQLRGEGVARSNVVKKSTFIDILIYDLVCKLFLEFYDGFIFYGGVSLAPF